MTRVKAICDYAELRGVKTEIIDCEVKAGEVATEKAYQKFTDILNTKYSFTAVVGISGDSMQGAVNACHNKNVRIPDDLSMIAIGAESLTGTFYPPMTTVALDFGSQIKTALLLLDQIVNNPGQEVKSVYHRPVIIERKSVKII
jgi:DNA-binding LacI/PurR family transcriptional regulator